MKTIITIRGLDFMGKKRVAFVLSLILLLVSVGSLFTRGLYLGIDFTAAC